MIYLLFIYFCYIYIHLYLLHTSQATYNFFFFCYLYKSLSSIQFGAFFIVIIFISFNSYPHINSSRSWSMISAWNKYKFEYLHYSFLIECKVGILFFLLHLMKPIYTYNCEIIVCYFLCKNFYKKNKNMFVVFVAHGAVASERVCRFQLKNKNKLCKTHRNNKKKEVYYKEKRVFFFLFCKKQ